MQDLLLKLDRFWFVKVQSIHNIEYWWYACAESRAHALGWYQYDAVETEGRCSMVEGEIHEWKTTTESCNFRCKLESNYKLADTNHMVKYTHSSILHNYAKETLKFLLLLFNRWPKNITYYPSYSSFGE